MQSVDCSAQAHVKMGDIKYLFVTFLSNHVGLYLELKLYFI